MKKLSMLSACLFTVSLSLTSGATLIHAKGEAVTDTSSPTATHQAAQVTDQARGQEAAGTSDTTDQSQTTPSNTEANMTSSQPTIKKLAQVKKVKLTRFSTTAVKVSWLKSSQAKYYHVYTGTRKKGTYKLSGTTKKTHFLVKGLKNKKTYYFYVTASKSKKVVATDSAPSTKQSMTMKTYTRKITFAGDSIATGISLYKNTTYAMKSSAKKSVVAVVGINTRTFVTKRAFNGKTPLQKLIREKPYRVYFMLGINEIGWTKKSAVLENYEVLIKRLLKGSPKTDVVLLSVSPVSRAEMKAQPQMKQIPALNSGLKKLAAKNGYHYYDYTSFLKDKQGYLKAKYATQDGLHWQLAAYKKFGEVIGHYDRSLDD
jgi:lysophospholipase L1-like esterase